MAAINLSTLFPTSLYTQVSSSGNTLGVIYVYNTNTNTLNNGGQCCLFTAPAGSTYAKFEVWGGGGAGAGSCCCQHAAYSGGSGSYARKTIQLVPGQQYTVCAGGSSTSPAYSSTGTGVTGNPSYVCGNNSNSGITYPITLCANGGGPGSSQCNYWQNACNIPSCICGGGCGYDLLICGSQAGSQASTCGLVSWAFAAEPTYVGGGVRMSCDHCQNGCGSAFGGCATFPGGGGMSGNTNGGSCSCGGWGAGGLVIITYK